jgi:hypothetical protein
MQGVNNQEDNGSLYMKRVGFDLAFFVWVTGTLVLRGCCNIFILCSPLQNSSSIQHHHWFDG